MNLTRNFRFVAIPLLSAVIALLSVISGHFLAAWSERSQETLKTFEVTFPEKQKCYTQLMSLLSDSFYSASWQQQDDHFKSVNELETLHYTLEPFLSEAARGILWKKIQLFIAFCDRIRSENPTTDIDVEFAVKEFNDHRNQIRTLLFPELFERK